MYFIELEAIISRGLEQLLSVVSVTTSMTISSLYSYSTVTKGVIAMPLQPFAVIQLAKRASEFPSFIHTATAKSKEQIFI